MMDSNLLSSIKREQLENDLENPGVHSSTKETLNEGEIFDKMEMEMPDVKKEQPKVYDHPNYPDFKPVKQELSWEWCKDKTHKFSKTEDIVSSIIPYMTGQNNTEPAVIERDYKVLFHLENCSRLSENVSSVIESNNRASFTNNNFPFHNSETVNQSQISRRSLDFTVGSARSIDPNEEAPYIISYIETETQTMGAPYKQQVYGAAATKANHQKYQLRAENEENLPNCDDSITSFTQEGNEQDHKRTGTGKKLYNCDVCDASFNHPSNLKRHKRTHTGEKPFKCDVCETSFNRTCHLRQHKRKHTGEKPYKCDVCETSFSRACHLRRHKRKHTGEKPFICDVCEASFNHPSNLKRHKRIHTLEKPYKCDVCGASFIRFNSLKCHIRLHTGEKPFKCDICGASFTAFSGLSYHKKTHTGEKPFKCDICGSSFTTVSSLSCHKRTHRRETFQL